MPTGILRFEKSFWLINSSRGLLEASFEVKSIESGIEVKTVDMKRTFRMTSLFPSAVR